MRRLGIFAFFAFLMSMCFLKIDDGEGAGSDEGDIFDQELDDEGATPPAKDDKKGGDDKKPDDKPPAKETKPDPDKMLLEEIRQERVLNAITKEFTKEYGDGFNMDQIVAKLEEMEKEKPGSGNKLFNKAGIELVYLKHFANQDEDGEFDGSSGRSKKAPTSDELIDKINSGKASDKETATFYAKYA